MRDAKALRLRCHGERQKQHTRGAAPTVIADRDRVRVRFGGAHARNGYFVADG